MTRNFSGWNVVQWILRGGGRDIPQKVRNQLRCHTAVVRENVIACSFRESFKSYEMLHLMNLRVEDGRFLRCCSLYLSRYWPTFRSFLVPLSPWCWKKQELLERLSVSTLLHGATSQKTFSYTSPWKPGILTWCVHLLVCIMFTLCECRISNCRIG
jgi:hypothetical protein